MKEWQNGPVTIRWAISLLWCAVLTSALPGRAFAAAHEIVIKAAKLQGGVALISGEQDGKSVQLECFVSDSTCKVPKPGRYLIGEVGTDKSTYQDCVNVELFEIAPEGSRGRVGVYCALTDVGGQ